MQVTRWKILATTAVICVAVATPAAAYLDPGTGSIMAQAIIGAVVAVGVFWRTWWHRLTAFLRRGKDDGNQPSPDSTPGTG